MTQRMTKAKKVSRQSPLVALNSSKKKKWEKKNKRTEKLNKSILLVMKNECNDQLFVHICCLLAPSYMFYWIVIAYFFTLALFPVSKFFSLSLQFCNILCFRHVHTQFPTILSNFSISSTFAHPFLPLVVENWFIC